MVSNLKAEGSGKVVDKSVCSTGRTLPVFSMERSAFGFKIRIIGYFRLEQSPLADPRVKGLVDVQGERYSVFDTAALTSIGPRELTDSCCVVIDRDFRGGKFAKARLVGDVWEMLEIAKARRGNRD
jgi:chemotaxis signal transduction protein